MQLSLSQTPRSISSAGYLLRQHGGAAAAYSLQRLDTSTENVIRVRESVGDTEADFTAEEVSGGALREFALQNDADLIRFANQATAADKRMYFDGVDDRVILGVDLAAAGKIEFYYMHQDQTQYAAIIGQRTSAGTDEIYISFPTSAGNVIEFHVNNGSTPQSSAMNEGQIYKITAVWGSGDLELFIDDVSQGASTFTGGVTAIPYRVGDVLPNEVKGLIYDLDIYDTDQTTLLASYKGYGTTLADWEDQTANGNDATLIIGSPALFSGQGFDAYVTTWYDQSGNGRDATQATAASQPQIVADGVVVTDANGKPSMDFDGTNDYLASSYSAAITSHAVFLVADMDSTTASVTRIYSHDTGIDDVSSVDCHIPALRNGTNAQVAAYDGAFIGTKTISYDTPFLWSCLHSGSLISTFLDGSAGTTSAQTLNATITRQGIGTSAQKLGAHKGFISEVIVYHSDQSANRAAIEANIAGRYGITLA